MKPDELLDHRQNPDVLRLSTRLRELSADESEHTEKLQELMRTLEKSRQERQDVEEAVILGRAKPAALVEAKTKVADLETQQDGLLTYLDATHHQRAMVEQALASLKAELMPIAQRNLEAKQKALVEQMHTLLTQAATFDQELRNLQDLSQAQGLRLEFRSWMVRGDDLSTMVQRWYDDASGAAAERHRKVVADMRRREEELKAEKERERRKFWGLN